MWEQWSQTDWITSGFPILLNGGFSRRRSIRLIYGIQVWSSCNNDLINTLFKLQKKAIRIIHGLPYNGHTESFFKASNILTLPKLIEFFKMQFMQQFAQGFLPGSFEMVWTTNANRSNFEQPYRLRNNDDLFLPISRLASIILNIHCILSPKAGLSMILKFNVIKLSLILCWKNTSLIY